MFGFKAFATQPFASFTQAVQEIVAWGRTGGIGKKHKEELKKSQRAEMKEHVKALFEEPAVIEEIKEDIKEYAKPNKSLSATSINYSKLVENADLVSRIIAKVQEIQQEQEDEEILLMLGI